jgi:hypothetical protein
MDTIVCDRCKGVVARTETEFAPNGDLLCRRCGNLEEAHEQLDRAVRAGGGKPGDRIETGVRLQVLGASVVSPTLTVSPEAHRRFDRELHTAHPPSTGRSFTCSQCPATFPLNDASYDVNGAPLCPKCFGSYDVAAVQAEARRRMVKNAIVPVLLMFALLALYVWARIQR